MLPLFDENPARRRPVVTWVLIGLSIIIYFMVNETGLARTDTFTTVRTAPGTVEGLSSELRFTLEHAAIPCEIVQQRPLSNDEVVETYFGGQDRNACRSDETGPALFPDKGVMRAMVSSIFLHGGLFHLALNMLFLWVFGNNVEDRLGRVAFAAFYLLSGIVATVAYVAFQPSGTVAILGASGAIAGIMGSYLVWYPDAPIRTLVFLVLVDIRARWFLLAWVGIQFFAQDGPGPWIAHVAGFVFGVVSGRLVRRFQPRLRLSLGQRTLPWDVTGGAGHGPYPHLDEVWDEPHHEFYERQANRPSRSTEGAVDVGPTDEERHQGGEVADGQ